MVPSCLTLPSKKKKPAVLISELVQLLVELAILLASLRLANAIRAAFSSDPALLVGVEIPAPVYAILTFVWIALWIATRSYRSIWRSEYWTFLRVGVSALIIFFSSYLFMSSVSRAIYALFFVLASVFLIGYHFFVETRWASAKQVQINKIFQGGYRPIALSWNDFLFRHHADTVLALLIGLLIVRQANLAGVSFSPDSREYILAATRLRYSGQFVFLPHFPPLFSLLIALLTFALPDPEQAATVLVFASTIAVFFVFCLILRTISKNVVMNVIFLFLFGSMNSVIQISSKVWSEMSYLCLALASLYYLGKAQTTSSKVFLYCAFGFTSLAMLMRYIGIVIPVAFVITIFLTQTKKLRSRVAESLALAAVSFIPLALYVLRNSIAFGTAFGQRRQTYTLLSTNLQLTADTFVNDLGPLVMIILLGLLVYATTNRIWIKRDGAWIPLFSIFYIALYLGFLLFSALIYGIDSIQTRLLFPLYPFLILTVAALTFLVLRETQEIKNKSIRFFIPILIISGLLASLAFNLFLIDLTV